MIKMLQYKMYPAGELAVLRQLLFLFLLKNIDCGYSLELPRRGGSNEYHNLWFEQKYEEYKNFLSDNFHFLVVKFSVYLNRHVFVMT